MHDDQELNIDELSAVIGGATSSTNGSLPHPKPSPVDQIIQWIRDALK
jgi:bacteriocin-like protein